MQVSALSRLQTQMRKIVTIINQLCSSSSFILYSYVTMDQTQLRNMIINTQIPDNAWWASISLR